MVLTRSILIRFLADKVPKNNSETPKSWRSHTVWAIQHLEVKVFKVTRSIVLTLTDRILFG